MSSSATKETQEEFDQRMDSARAAQGLGPNSVPEQRPVASQQVDPASESPVYQKELENGERDPMPKSAYDKAASKSQSKKAEKQEQKLGPENLIEGQSVTITKGKFKGAVGVIVDITWASQDDATKAKSGDPSVARFAKAASYSVRTRGQQSLASCKPSEVELHTSGLGPNASEL